MRVHLEDQGSQVLTVVLGHLEILVPQVLPDPEDQPDHWVPRDLVDHRDQSDQVVL